MPLYLSESAISKVQSTPARTARRSQSKAKSRPPEPEVDLQLLKTLCQENDCNSEEVWAPHPVFYRYTIVRLLALSHCVTSLIYPFVVVTGEECVPDQFLSFPGLTRSVRSPTISSGQEVDHPNTCSTLCLALHLRFHYSPHSARLCHHRTSVRQLLSAPPYFLPVCFHIYDVRKMCTQEEDCFSVSIAHHRVR